MSLSESELDQRESEEREVCVRSHRGQNNNYSTRGSPYVHLILLAHLSMDICQWAHVCEGEPFARDIPTVCKYECEPIAGLTATDSECELI